MALAEARVALATAVLGEPHGTAACLRILEALVHRGRLSGRTLLLERPVPGWVESHVRLLHGQAGCRWRALEPPPWPDQRELSRSLAALPWSGEWLVRVLDGIPDPATPHARYLAAEWQARRNAFVEAHIGLVAFVVRRRGPLSGIERDDLIQEGLLALCRAVERYDPERGTRFSSYAVPVVRHAIVQFVRRIGYAPEAPRHLSVTVATTPPPSTRSSNGSAAHGRKPTLLSLDAEIQTLDEAASLAEHLADPDVLPPDTAVIQSVDRERFRHGLAALPRDAQWILTLRWGLDGSPPRSLAAVARRVGKSPTEIRSVIADSFMILRRFLTLAREHTPVFGAGSISQRPVNSIGGATSGRGSPEPDKPRARAYTQSVGPVRLVRTTDRRLMSALPSKGIAAQGSRPTVVCMAAASNLVSHPTPDP